LVKRASAFALRLPSWLRALPGAGACLHPARAAVRVPRVVCDDDQFELGVLVRAGCAFCARMGVCVCVRVRACVWTDRSCGVGAGLGFKSGAGGGFYKLSADHSECKQASNIGNNTKSWHVGTVSQAAPHRWFGSGCLSHSRAQALMCVYAGVQMCSARMPGTSGPRAAFSAESSTRRCVVFVYGVCVVYVSLAGVPV